MVVEAIGDRTDLVVVAQSLGGFTAPLVCDRVPVALLILVAAMVPLPGESPGDWWANTGWEQARRQQAERDGRPTDGDFDPVVEFFHDVPPDVVTEAFARGVREQSGTPFEKPWPLDGVAGRADEVSAVSRRPLLPGRVHAARRAGALGHHARRDGRRPLACVQPPERARRPSRGVPPQHVVRARRSVTAGEPSGSPD